MRMVREILLQRETTSPARRSPSAKSPSAKPRPASSAATRSYAHPESDSPMRPDIGTQAQFRKKKASATYQYDSSLSPALDWDGQKPTRELGEALIARISNATSLEEAKDIDDGAEDLMMVLERGSRRLRHGLSSRHSSVPTDGELGIRISRARSL